MFGTMLVEDLAGDLGEPWPPPGLLEPDEDHRHGDDEPDEGVPCTVANYLPSGWLGLELDVTTQDPAALGDADLIDAIVGLDRMASWAQARQARLLAEFARRRPGDDPAAAASEKPAAIFRYAPDEVALALHLARGTAMSRLGYSAQLATVLPDTLTLWEQGRLDQIKVRAICDTVRYLSPTHAAAVQQRVLPRAPQQTVAQLRAALTRAVLAVDPDGAAARHREARKDRRVTIGDEKDGMASLWAMLPAPDATASYEWLSRLARGMGAQDPRGMDARRADLLVALITGRLTIEQAPDGETETPEAAGAPIRIPHPPAAPGKPLIHIVMPYSTLTGADDQPCELTGYGPIPADLAREIAADAVWKRLITDPLSGAVLDHGRTTYRPPDALADFVRARDVHCRSPICGRRALNCELDHTQAWADGGVTADHNLWAGCPHDHHLKHDAGWTVTQHDDGRITWRTPTGHTYTSTPHDYRPEIPTSRPAPTEAPTAAATPATTAAPVPDEDEPPF